MKETKVILERLKALTNERNRIGMARFGITTDKAFGINIPILRNLAKEYKKEHELAIDLWKTEYHEARLLAIFIADPKKVDEALMEEWLCDFNSWDICDQAIMNVFDKHPMAFKKALEWSERENEFEKRAGFAMMASLAVHLKREPDKSFAPFFKVIEKHSDDPRNFVKKAVNWALRQIGKRNLILRQEAIDCANRILALDTTAGRWIAKDAIKELEDAKTMERLIAKSYK